MLVAIFFSVNHHLSSIQALGAFGWNWKQSPTPLKLVYFLSMCWHEHVFWVYKWSTELVFGGPSCDQSLACFRFVVWFPSVTVLLQPWQCWQSAPCLLYWWSLNNVICGRVCCCLVPLGRLHSVPAVMEPHGGSSHCYFNKTSLK